MYHIRPSFIITYINTLLVVSSKVRLFADDCLFF